MYVRCPKCLEPTRFRSSRPEGRPRCGACGHRYSFECLERLGSTPLERSARAEKFARSNEIDLASAYAVLLGILPLERALSTAAADDLQAPTAPQQTPDASAPRPLNRHYDPNFIDAVATGRLTAWGAIQRGDRVVYASRVSQQYDLPMDLSFRVTDNELSLVEARKMALGRQIARHAASLRSMGPLSRLALVLGVAALAGWVIWQLEATKTDRERPDRAQSSRQE